MIRAADIIHVVSLATGVDILDMGANRQPAAPTRARHIAMYLCTKCLDASQTEIGRAFGNRDHSTVSLAVSRIAEEMETDATLKALVTSLQQSIDYRMTIEAIGKVDVLAVARSIALQPRRGVVAASTFELAALAVFALDLWEVASCAQAMAHTIAALPETDDADQAHLRAFAGAILDEMNHIAGTAPATDERTEA